MITKIPFHTFSDRGGQMSPPTFKGRKQHWVLQPQKMSHTTFNLFTKLRSIVDRLWTELCEAQL